MARYGICRAIGVGAGTTLVLSRRKALGKRESVTSKTAGKLIAELSACCRHTLRIASRFSLYRSLSMMQRANDSIRVPYHSQRDKKCVVSDVDTREATPNENQILPHVNLCVDHKFLCYLLGVGIISP